jgi:LacI family transcriptional regulator
MRHHSKYLKISDVAKIAGISPRTAADILLGDARRTSPRLRERVRLVAEHVGHPSPPGTHILYLHSQHRDASYLTQDLMHGIMTATQSTACHIEIQEVADHYLDNEPTFRQLIRDHHVSGLLVNYQVGYPQVMPALMERIGIPAVWINCPQAHDCVGPADFEAAKSLTNQALAFGHHRIAYVDLTSNFTEHALHHSSLERLAGYEYAMKEAGLPSRLIGVELPLDKIERQKLLCSHLKSTGRPTFFIAFCPRSALSVLQMAISECGLHIPNNESIATFCHDLPDRDGTDLTSMVLPWEQIGQASILRLLARCQQPGLRFTPLLVPCRWHPGSTCQPLSD